MNTNGDEHYGNGVPTAMHGVSQATKKIEQDSAAGEFLGQRKVGKKSRNNETEKKEKSAEGAEPRKSGGEGGEGRVGAESIGGARKKKKGEAKEGGHAENPIEENGEGGPRLLMGKPADQIKKANGVSSGRADQKKIKKEADESQMNRAEVGERNLLQTENKVEAGSTEKNGAEGNGESGRQPKGVGRGKAVGEAGPVYFTREKSNDPSRDEEANPRREAT